MILAVGIIIGVFCLCFCIALIVFVAYQINVNKNVSALPISYQFNKKANSRLLGHAIQTIDDVSEDDCVKKCYENPYCLGATYKIDKKTCDLQYVNADTAATFVSDWDNSSLYSRIDTTSAFEVTDNNFLDSPPLKQIAAKTYKDCATACVGYVGDTSDDVCLSANFDSSKGMCDILGETNKSNPAAYGPKTGITHLYRKGMVGGYCSGTSGLDCIFGVCKDSKCLAASASATGEQCIQDYECQSGKCAKTDVPMDAQEKQRQVMLLDSGTAGQDAKFCDKYKTQKDCETTMINPTTRTDGTCVWNVTTCFPKSIKRYVYLCT